MYSMSRANGQIVVAHIPYISSHTVPRNIGTSLILFKEASIPVNACCYEQHA